MGFFVGFVMGGAVIGLILGRAATCFFFVQPPLPSPSFMVGAVVCTLVLRYGSYISSEKSSAAVVVPSEAISPVAAAVRWVAVIAEVRRTAIICFLCWRMKMLPIVEERPNKALRKTGLNQDTLHVGKYHAKINTTKLDNQRTVSIW
jgi:hypothetical protein